MLNLQLCLQVLQYEVLLTKGVPVTNPLNFYAKAQ
jgi:hypothetical protein